MLFSCTFEDLAAAGTITLLTGNELGILADCLLSSPPYYVSVADCLLSSPPYSVSVADCLLSSPSDSVSELSTIVILNLFSNALLRVSMSRKEVYST